MCLPAAGALISSLRTRAKRQMDQTHIAMVTQQGHNSLRLPSSAWACVCMWMCMCVYVFVCLYVGVCVSVCVFFATLSHLPACLSVLYVWLSLCANLYAVTLPCSDHASGDNIENTD